MRLHQNANSKRAALTGTMITIDPSSFGSGRDGTLSEAGFAIFKKGKLIESGTLGAPEEKVVFKRLRNVLSIIKAKFTKKYDLLVIERIAGYRAQASLIQSCGVYIVGINSDEFLELNVATWKSIAKAWGGYEKGDEADAIYIGYSAICIALGYVSAKPKALKKAEHDANKDRIIAEAKELVGWQTGTTKSG